MDITIQGLLERLAVERSLRLTDKLSDYVSTDQETKAKVESILARTSEVSGSLDTISSKIGNLPSGSTIYSEIGDVKSGVEGVNTSIQQKIANLNKETKNVAAAVSSLSDTVSQVQASIGGVNEAVDNVSESVSGLVSDLDHELSDKIADLSTTVETVKTDLSAAVTAVEEGLSKDLDTLTKQFGVSLNETAVSLQDVVSKTKAAISGLVSDVQNTLDDSVVTDLSKVLTKLNEINSKADSIKGFTTKWDGDAYLERMRSECHAYYEVYADLSKNLTLLESQVVQTYARWMEEATKASNKQLETADLLDQVDQKLEDLRTHESDLQYIIGQFDKMVLVSHNIAALATIWETDHDTINSFVEIVKKQKVYDASMVAANIGQALEGAAAMANTLKPQSKSII